MAEGSQFSWYDQAKLQALIDKNGSAQPLGNAEMTSVLNPLSGVTTKSASYMRPGAMQIATSDGGGDWWRDGGFEGGEFYTSFGQRMIGVEAPANDPDGIYIQYADNGGGGMQAPTGSKRDRVQPIYKLQPDGTAIPVSANSNYQPSGWVDWGRDVAILAATMATAYVGGAYLQAAQAGAGAAGAGGLTAEQVAYGALENAAATGGGGGGAAAGAAGVEAAGATAASAEAAAGVTQLAPVTVTAAPLPAAGVTLGEAATAATAAGGAAQAASGGENYQNEGRNPVDRANMGSTYKVPTVNVNDPTLVDMARQAGQSVTDFLKTPAGLKAAATLASAAVGAGAGGDDLSSGAAGQKSAADTQAEIARQQWQRYLTKFGPLEDQLINESLDYGSNANREKKAAEAAGAVTASYASLRERLNSTPGLDPSSQKYLDTISRIGVNEAAQTAATANGARDKVDAEGRARLSDAVSLGKGLPGNAVSALNSSAATYGQVNNAQIAADRLRSENNYGFARAAGDFLTSGAGTKLFDTIGGMFGG